MSPFSAYRRVRSLSYLNITMYNTSKTISYAGYILRDPRRIARDEKGNTHKKHYHLECRMDAPT